MADKLLIPCLYLQSGKAVTGFGQRNLFGDGNIENLVRFYRDNGADELLIFDISSGDTEHEQAISNIKSICSAAEIPVMAAGNINRMEDVKKLLYAGCAKVVLNFSKANNISLLEEVSKRFGKEKMAVCISSTEEFTANQALIESFADEVLALDTIQDEIHACSSIKIILHTEVSKTAALKSLLQKNSVYALSGAYISSLDISLQDFKADCKADGIPVVTFESAIAWADFKLNSDGLIPVVVQDYKTDQVLMVAYMNEEAFNNTLKTGKMTYWSRSRQELWRKGETSGNVQRVVSITADCDKDALVIDVVKSGPACHTGAESCFFNPVYVSDELKQFTWQGLYALIEGRKTDPKEGSYTTYLFDKGLEKILKKVGEESTEVIIAGSKRDREETIYEISDLAYHVMVLMIELGISVEDITKELEKRHVIDHKVKQERMQ